MFNYSYALAGQEYKLYRLNIDWYTVGYNFDNQTDQYEVPQWCTFSKNQTYTKQNVNIFGQTEDEEE